MTAHLPARGAQLASEGYFNITGGKTLKINGETGLIGILGDPVAHSLSPAMHNAAYQAMGLNIAYVPLPAAPAQLQAAVAGLRAMRFLGANVTIPHKVAVAALLDRLDISAARVGAVNTIASRDGVLTGHNTDGTGFIRALNATATVDLSSSAAVIFGAGGAARSVAMALAEAGVPRLAVVNRSLDKAEELKGLLSVGFPDVSVSVATPEEGGARLVSTSQIVINATSVGMDGDLKSVPPGVDRLSEGHVVCDLVYTRSKATPLAVAAQKKGATFMGGLEMLLMQGAASIQIWTGREPPIDVMRKALEP